MIDSWANNFISPEIADNITCFTNTDYHEWESYTISLESENYENNLQAAQGENFLPDESDLLITVLYVLISMENELIWMFGW